MNWLIANVGIVAVVLTNFALMVRDHVKLQDILKWQEHVDQHMVDYSRHLDDRTWEDLKRRLEIVERKLDKLIALEIQISNRNKQKGDSYDT